MGVGGKQEKVKGLGGEYDQNTSYTFWDREMAQQLRAHTAPAKTLSSQACAGWLMTASNSSSKSTYHLWPPQEAVLTCTYLPPHTHSHNHAQTHNLKYILCDQHILIKIKIKKLYGCR